MTREEAIADIRDNIKPVVGGKSLDMAIKALEQEPCEDAISRQVVLDTISELNAISFYEAQEDSKECYYEIKKAIEQLQPKVGHWIDKFGGVYRCSCCREIISIDTEIEFPNGITYKYCPNCGSYNGGEK